MKQIERLDKSFLSTVTDYTLPQILQKQAQQLGSEGTAIREKSFGIWQSYNWNDYFQCKICKTHVFNLWYFNSFD